MPSKGSSIFSPIVSSNRVLSSSSASVINRTSDHTKVMDAKITYIQTGVHYSKPSSSSSLPMSGTATVQVIASGTAAHTHIAPLQSNKSFSVVPSPNVLKIGSPNAQNSQSLSGSNSSTAVTTYRVPPPPNSITFSRSFCFSLFFRIQLIGYSSSIMNKMQIFTAKQYQVSFVSCFSKFIISNLNVYQSWVEVSFDRLCSYQYSMVGFY